MTIPNKASSSRLYNLFARWSYISYRYSAWIILIAVLATVVCGLYVSRNLGMNTDTTDMLSEDLPFRINMTHYSETFPQDIDTLLLVVDAPTPEQAYTFTARLAARLSKDHENYYSVYSPNVDDFFSRNGLLYESIPELELITDRLAAAQPLMALIAREPTLATFASVLTGAVDELQKGRTMELEPVLAAVSATVDARTNGSPRELSWQSLFDAKPQKKAYQELIVVKPRLHYDQLFPAEQSIAAIHAAAKDIGITENSPVRLRITGEVALSHEELTSSLQGMEVAGVITFVLVGIVLYFAMRTPGLIFAVLICLSMGLLLTAAFATAAVGHLNLISIAFAVLYIGLGADFAIHFLLRHQELTDKGEAAEEAIYDSGGDAGAALAACTITNAIGFYAFIPTDYSGVAELGIISGTGMIISLFVTLTIGPALLRYFPKRPSRARIQTISVGRVLELSLKWHKLTYALTLILAVAALAVLPQARFDYNLLNLQDPKGKALQTFRELLADAEHSPWQAVVLAGSPAEAQSLAQRLAALPEVNKVVTMMDFIPEDQQQKLVLIEELALTMGPIVFSERPNNNKDSSAKTLSRQREELNRLAAALNGFIATHPDHPTSAAARSLKSSLAALFAHLDSMRADEEKDLLRSLENDLLATLPQALDRLRMATEASPFEEKDLPVSLTSHWLSQSGEYRLAVYPAEDINDNQALRRFVNAVQEVAPQATGAPMVTLEAGDAVVQAFIQAFSLALLGITVALLILLRSVKYTLLVLAPLLLSSLFTAAFTVLLDIPFNFANVIALPLLLGIGIDSSLHMVHRSLNNELVSEILIHTSTARAIFYSALTALVDFASLMFSPHQGTASMGVLLTVGLALTLICTLVILPVLLRGPGQSLKT
jgi:hopanoid biosynthesis associated RND transporter like protein HpnN